MAQYGNESLHMLYFFLHTGTFGISSGIPYGKSTSVIAYMCDICGGSVVSSNQTETVDSDSEWHSVRVTAFGKRAALGY